MTVLAAAVLPALLIKAADRAPILFRGASAVASEAAFWALAYACAVTLDKPSACAALGAPRPKTHAPRTTPGAAPVVGFLLSSRHRQLGRGAEAGAAAPDDDDDAWVEVRREDVEFLDEYVSAERRAAERREAAARARRVRQFATLTGIGAYALLLSQSAASGRQSQPFAHHRARVT